MTSPELPAGAPLPQVEATLRTHFAAGGAHSADRAPLRASVSFVGVDPIEVLRFDPRPDERVYASLGMSRFPMTAADEPVRARQGPRAELLLHVRDPADEYVSVWRRVAVLAAAPAVEGIVHAPGVTLDLGEPLAPGSSCTGAVVSAAAVGPVDTPVGEVAVLQLLPATPTELAWARVRGSSALRARWVDRGTDLLDLRRRPVELD